MVEWLMFVFFLLLFLLKAKESVIIGTTAVSDVLEPNS
jgi:hypothetical protein